MFLFGSRQVRARLLLTLILALCFVPTRAARNQKAHPVAEDPDLLKQRRAANDLMRAGKFLQAIDAYQRGYDEAQRRGDTRSARRFQANMGSAYFRLLRYRDAARAFLKVRALALREGDNEALFAVAVNLSSLYFETGELDAATESAQFGLALPAGAGAKFRPELLIQSALIQLRQGNCPRATALIREAIELSRNAIDPAAEAQGWNEL
jgi:tetratricopeptide (TPR) repeat protein